MTIDLNILIEEQKKRERDAYRPVWAEIELDVRPPREPQKIDYEVRYDVRGGSA